MLDYFICEMKYDYGVYKTPVVVMKKYDRTLKAFMIERAKKAKRF